MREGESSLVVAALREVGVDVTVINAAATFAAATTTLEDGTQTARLDETVNPEHKRRIIGDTFMRVSEAHLATLGWCADDVLLAQGTLRPDLIESANADVGGAADVIKTHHNDTALVRELRARGRIGGYHSVF